jgi:hypothetical protein
LVETLGLALSNLSEANQQQGGIAVDQSLVNLINE